MHILFCFDEMVDEIVTEFKWVTGARHAGKGRRVE